MTFDFTAVAHQYAAYRPHYPNELAAELTELCRARELAWDIGCGSGQLTQSLAPEFARVIGTDPSQGQLDNAPKLANVEYRRATAEASTLADASVDLAVAAQAAHWFDWPRFVAEAARVAKPGGVVALVSYGIIEVDDAPSIHRYYFETLAGFWPPERRHVENGYRDLVWPWPELTAPKVAMRAEWTRAELIGYVTTWSATAKLVAERGSAPLDAFVAELAHEWPDDHERRTIRWPLTLRLARVP
ncbi:MAG TPA: class I SAM-dependent methyltransferase [Kofleriaceae bacterium]|jgi:SAM-dependent methyltransferase